MSVNVFSYTGSSQTYVVPDGVFRVYVDMLGGSGIGGTGNLGARLQGFLRVVPGQVLNLYVGGQGELATNQIGGFGGYNGGGTGGSVGGTTGGGHGGGGATDIRVGGTALANRICVLRHFPVFLTFFCLCFRPPIRLLLNLAGIVKFDVACSPTLPPQCEHDKRQRQPH